MKLDFDQSLLHHIAGLLICCIICLSVIILSNFSLFTQPGDAADQPLFFSTDYLIYGSRKAYILTFSSLVVLIIAGANMVDRTKIYLAYHQAKTRQNKEKPAND